MANKKRNLRRYTIDEIKTAATAYTEGYPHCDRKTPVLRINTCVKEMLEPVSRAMKATISPVRTKERITCKPQDFPPDGKGFYQITIRESRLRQVYGLIPERYVKDWQRRWQEKGCPKR